MSGSSSSRVTTPSRSISGASPITTLAQPQAGASGPPSTCVWHSNRGPGRPASRNSRYRSGPRLTGRPACSNVVRSHPRTWSHSGGCGLAHRYASSLSSKQAMPPGRTSETARCTPATMSGRYSSTSRPTTASKPYSTPSSFCTSPTRNSTFGASVCDRASSTAAGSCSIPSTDPSGPTSSAAIRATLPAPLPRSSTRIPVVSPASRSRRRVYGSKPCPCWSSRSCSAFRSAKG